jgi:creatinine amidohydrolase
MLWQERSWPEIEEASKKHFLVIQPCGSLEQHSTYLPEDTDTSIVSEIAKRAAEEAGRTLVLPCLPYGISWHHLDFPGTVSLSLETYCAMIKDVGKCVAHHGFRILILLNGHGGNSAALNAISGSFLHEINLRIMAVTYWDIIDKDEVGKIRSSSLGGMNHACEFETSCQLALRGHLVRTDRYTAKIREVSLPHMKKDMFFPGAISFPRKVREYSEKGVVGDPSSATIEKGEKFLKLAVVSLADLLRKILEQAH